MAWHIAQLIEPNYRAFNVFYQTHAPALWGVILQAVPTPQAETILTNTLIQAWNEFEQHQTSDRSTLSWLLALACRHGLPKSSLQSILVTRAVTKQPIQGQDEGK